MKEPKEPKLVYLVLDTLKDEPIIAENSDSSVPQQKEGSFINEDAEELLVCSANQSMFMYGPIKSYFITWAKKAPIWKATLQC